MPYGIIKVDTVTFTDNGVDKDISLSGLVQNPTFTGNVTATGTISGDIIRGGTTISGATVTGTTANFTSGVFTTQLSGVTITGTTVATTTGTFTSLTGTTTTGTTANFVSGVFSTQVSGVTITGTTVAATTGTFTSLTGTTATFTSGIIASGTAALPSLAILSDPNTGIYSPGADQLAVATNGTGRLFIDSSGRLLVGTSTATGEAILQVQTPTTLSTTSGNGVSFTNTSTKVYPTTASFTVIPGFQQNLELGTAQTIDTVTPGGFNFVYGQRHLYTKSAGNTQDIKRLNFGGFRQTFVWADANTCEQYVGFDNVFNYRGMDANGRTSNYLGADSLGLGVPDGGTQTIQTVYGANIFTNPAGTGTVNVTNSSNFSPDISFFNSSAGTKTVNITNHAFYENYEDWGASGTTGTLNATITNLYGLRLRPPSSTIGLTVTNNWGIYQEWSSAKNWFAGASNQFPNITTTASGANAFLDSADSNRLYRSTSSLTYKRDVEDLDSNLADQILNLRPVWYRSKCTADCEDWSWYGLIAEEVAEIDPRFVHYGYQEDAYEFVETTETVNLRPNDPRREAGIETEEVTKQTRQLKPDAEQVPNGVAYERLVVPLLDIIKRQKSQLDSFEARLAALESA